MTYTLEQLSKNNSIKKNKELFNTEEEKNNFINKIMEEFFDDNWYLTNDWRLILNDIRLIWNNELIYINESNNFKESIKFNLEKYRNQSNKEENSEKNNIVDRWIEAEYSYIDQDKLWQINKKDKFDSKKISKFAKMELTNLYELCELDKVRKKEFVIALMKNNKTIYENEYLAMLSKDIKNQIPDLNFNQNLNANNSDLIYFNQTNESELFQKIWNKLSNIWNDIKKILDSWIWLWNNIKDVIKKAIENWEEKENFLINDFNTKYKLLSKDLKNTTDEKTWFSWSIIQDKNWNKTLLIRWSDDWNDWTKNNTKIFKKDKLPPQVESVINFIEEAKTKWIINVWEKINIVWHSLGGWLAQISSLMYSDLVNKTYTFNAPWIAWINPILESENNIVKQKINDYTIQLEAYKKQKENNPNFEEDFILNIRNNDFVWNFDDKNHIWKKSWNISWYSHFLDSLNSSIREMNREEFREKFKIWINKNNKNNILNN